MKSRIIKDRVFFGAVCFFSALTAIPLVVIIWEVVKKGYKQINLSFFTETAPSTLDAMLAKSTGELIPGGIANGITGTLLMVDPAYGCHCSRYFHSCLHNCRNLPIGET